MPPLHPYVLARRHLVRKEPRFKTIIESVGTCTLKPDPDAFAVLARSIVAQQISSKAAMSISGRLVAACGKKGLRPERVAKLSDEEIRGCGLSGGKLLSLRSLTEHFLSDKALKDPQSLSDQEVHDHLIPIRGIGPWTVHMFLIFSLGRLDVLPVGDLGLRAGVQTLHGLAEMPAPAAVVPLAEPWRPYRSIATWYLWKYKGPVPQS
jgi:DNA-3-methyladenine glycosylase II